MFTYNLQASICSLSDLQFSALSASNLACGFDLSRWPWFWIQRICLRKYRCSQPTHHCSSNSCHQAWPRQTTGLPGQVLLAGCCRALQQAAAKFQLLYRLFSYCWVNKVQRSKVHHYEMAFFSLFLTLSYMFTDGNSTCLGWSQTFHVTLDCNSKFWVGWYDVDNTVTDLNTNCFLPCKVVH